MPERHGYGATVMRRLSSLVLVAVLAAAGAACGSDGAKTTTAGSGSSSSSTNAVVTTSIPRIATTAPTSTTQAAATSTTVGVGGATTSTSLPAPATAEEAARGLVDRWGASDRTGALQFATQEVIDSLFVNDGTGNTWMFQGCDGVAGGAVCSFSFEGGATQVHAQNLGTIGETGFRIDDIQFVAD
jgi:hypothetical protein